MGETNQHMRGRFVVTDTAGFIGSPLTDRLATGMHAVVGSDALTQSHICLLRLSVAGKNPGMLPKPR
jgi:nucleoside-diphosphate-sugar epimerase